MKLNEFIKNELSKRVEVMAEFLIRNKIEEVKKELESKIPELIANIIVEVEEELPANSMLRNVTFTIKS